MEQGQYRNKTGRLQVSKLRCECGGGWKKSMGAKWMDKITNEKLLRKMKDMFKDGVNKNNGFYAHILEDSNMLKILLKEKWIGNQRKRDKTRCISKRKGIHMHKTTSA